MLAELDVVVQRVAPVNGAVHVVDGASVYVERADGSTIAVWTTQAGNVAATLPLTSVNGRVNGWVEGGLLLRYRAVHSSLDPAVVWEYFTSGGGPVGPPGPTGPPGTMVAGAYSTPARVPATNYQPSTTRVVMVVATLQVFCGGSQEGRWDVKCANASPPATIIAQPLVGNGTANAVYVSTPVTFMVPVGFYYRFDSVAITGAPTFSVVRVVESVL